MMDSVWEQLQQALQVEGAVACWVEVQATQGSAPRKAGAGMAVLAPHAPGQPLRCWGTIGGGHLEWMAQQQALAWLAQGRAQQGLQGVQVQRVALGPSLGQCCGGAVQLGLSALRAADVPALRARLQPARTPVALFGLGHVGLALAQVLQPLPVALHALDSRADVLEQAQCARSWPAHWQWEHSAPVHQAVHSLPPQACVLAMSYSHQEDLDIVTACLQRQRQRGDVPFIGLIGSATKWSVFQRRLQARGFSAAEIAHITCPIGVPGIAGKEPEVIAVGVAAQLLQWHSQLHAQAAATAAGKAAASAASQAMV